MIPFILFLLRASRSLAFPELAQKHHPVAQAGCLTSTLCNKYIQVSDAEAGIPSKPNAAIKRSQSRTNCGSLGQCITFDPEQQYVSTNGEHEFVAPSTTDIRGPCPGLNAAANHNYIPHSGIMNITQAAQGLYNAYGLELEFGAFLAAFANAVSGNATGQILSIGGPVPNSIPDDCPGLSYSHSWYEGDASLSRCDAYTNHGDAHALSLTRFKYAYETGMANDRYTLDLFSRLYAQNTIRSIRQNRDYYVPFQVTGFQPAWYNFAINLMSNHSADEPAGYLDGNMLQQFFAITGDYPNFQWVPGHERIPTNWYRRPNENPYATANSFQDLLVGFRAYPDTLRFGGNVNGINTYVAVNLSMVTDGVYTYQNLLQGDRFACFTLTNVQATATLADKQPDTNNAPPSGPAIVQEYMPSYFDNLKCPQISTYNQSFVQNYAGGQYIPFPPTTGPQDC